MGYEFFRYFKPITNGIQGKTSAGQELINITHTSNKTLVEGAEATGDDLELKANTNDTYPYITINGNSDIWVTLGSNNLYLRQNAGISFGQHIQDGNGNYKIGTISNRDLAFEPNGTGFVRFGTYAGIVAETLQGYITIKDSAGNSRKIGVVA